MTQTRRRFPESFKREAVDQVLAGTPLRHVAETLGIAESLLGKWKRQYEQQGDDAFPGNGKQRGERDGESASEQGDPHHPGSMAIVESRPSWRPWGMRVVATGLLD